MLSNVEFKSEGTLVSRGLLCKVERLDTLRQRCLDDSRAKQSSISLLFYVMEDLQRAPKTACTRPSGGLRSTSRNIISDILHEFTGNGKGTQVYTKGCE